MGVGEFFYTDQRHQTIRLPLQARNSMKYVADQLQEGKTVTFNPRGNSMMPRIKSGQDVTVAPVDTKDVNVGDVVLCKVAGKIFLHLVKAIDNTKGFQIGNNKGHINGWTRTIYGKATNV